MLPLYIIVIIVTSCSTTIPYIFYINVKNNKKKDKFNKFLHSIEQNTDILIHSNSLEKINSDINYNTYDSYKAFKIIRSIIDSNRDPSTCCNPYCNNKLIDCINFKIYDGDFCSYKCQLGAFKSLEKYID